MKFLDIKIYDFDRSDAEPGYVCYMISVSDYNKLVANSRAEALKGGIIKYALIRYGHRLHRVENMWLLSTKNFPPEYVSFRGQKMVNVWFYEGHVDPPISKLWIPETELKMWNDV